MESTPPAPSPATVAEMSVAECAQQLKQRFPALFAGPVKPLKIRIQTDIQQRAPGVFSRGVLSAFFRRHTGTTAYLIAMTRSPHRYDLDGQPAGDVTDEHRKLATEELERRQSAHEAKARQAAEGRRFRADLLRDFERTTLTPGNFCALKGIAPEALDALLETARREAAERPRHAPPGMPPRSDRRPPRPRGSGPGRERGARPPRPPGPTEAGEG